MSGSSTSSQHDAGNEVDPPRQSAMPFLLAVSIVLVIVAGVVIAGRLSPAETNVTEEELVYRTVADFIQAHNHDDTEFQKSLVCPSYSEARSVLAGREGEITLRDVESYEVDGEQIRASVRIADAAGVERVDIWQLTRSGDTWVVCN